MCNLATVRKSALEVAAQFGVATSALFPIALIEIRDTAEPRVRRSTVA